MGHTTNFTSPKTTILREMLAAATEQPPLTAEDLSNRRKFATIVIACFLTVVLCIFAVTTFNHFRALKGLGSSGERNSITENGDDTTNILAGKNDCI